MTESSHEQTCSRCGLTYEGPTWSNCPDCGYDAACDHADALNDDTWIEKQSNPFGNC